MCQSLFQPDQNSSTTTNILLQDDASIDDTHSNEQLDDGAQSSAFSIEIPAEQKPLNHIETGIVLIREDAEDLTSFAIISVCGTRISGWRTYCYSIPTVYCWACFYSTEAAYFRDCFSRCFCHDTDPDRITNVTLCNFSFCYSWCCRECAHKDSTDVCLSWRCISVTVYPLSNRDGRRDGHNGLIPASCYADSGTAAADFLKAAMLLMFSVSPMNLFLFTHHWLKILGVLLLFSGKVLLFSI